MHRYAKKEEIYDLGNCELLSGAFNSFLSLPTFPCSLFYDRKVNSFLVLSRYEKIHYDKVYQPIYKCSICDIIPSKTILSSKNFHETCQLVDLVSFYQSTIYFSYIFITNLNKFLSKKLSDWNEVMVFFENLKLCNGFSEYLCWIDLYKSCSKESKQDVRLKFFRPNQMHYISSVPFSDEYKDLMESLVKNIATYWYPRLNSYMLKHDLNASIWDHLELRNITNHLLENSSVEELRNTLINIVSYEDLSGHVFQNFLLVNKLFQQSKYLTFIKACFSFYDGFSHDSVDCLWANRSAWKIISNYLMPGGRHYVYTPSNILEQIKNSSNPPYDDLFDGAVEYALFTLVPCMHRYLKNYLDMFDNISEESFSEIDQETSINEPLDVVDLDDENNVFNNVQNSPVISDNKDNRDGPQADSTSSAPVSDNLLSSILRSRSEYERFKAFLGTLVANNDDHTFSNVDQPANPLIDLDCYIDIEKFKLAKGKVAARDELASSIKQLYLTKKYFFGPASPAPRNIQIKVLGGSGHKMPPRPSSPVLLEVQKYVLLRLNTKWIKHYKSTEEFQRRQDRGGSALSRRKVNDNAQSFVFVDSKARANAHDMLQLRRTLMDHSKCGPLKRYAKAKGDRLLRDIEFWIEVQRYKDMHHRHSSTSLIRKKIDTIIDCFLDSTVFPKVQVSVPNDIAHKITESRYDLGPYIFRQAQTVVTKVLCNLWNEYNTWCAKFDHQPLPTAFNKLEIEAQQKRLVKQMLKQKQKEEEKERAFLDANTRLVKLL